MSGKFSAGKVVLLRAFREPEETFRAVHLG